MLGNFSKDQLIRRLVVKISEAADGKGAPSRAAFLKDAQMTETIPMSGKKLRTHASSRKVTSHPAVRQPPRPPGVRFRPLKRILQRWRECRRLAAPAPVNSRTSTEAEPVAEYVPKAGMRGKHVEWVPCSLVVLDKMLDMAKVTPDDYVIDPGSGDGRIVIRVAKLGARAHGIESNPKLVALARENAEKEGVGHRASFFEGDFFEADYSEATVVTLFLRKDLNMKLRPGILDLAPGTRVVSNIFDMGDWEADEVAKVEDGDYYFRNHTVHLWIVPAKVSGTWELPEGELVISQKFQMIDGTFISNGNIISIEGKLTGSRIDVTANGRKYTGCVTGDRMVLETNDGGISLGQAMVADHVSGGSCKN